MKPSRHLLAVLTCLTVVSTLATESIADDKDLSRATNYHVASNFPQLPAGISLGAISGVATDSSGNIFAFHRGKHPILILDRHGKIVRSFGDILVNNASAIDLSGTLDVSMKRYDLIHHVNTRGTFLTSKLCLPHLLKGGNPHILNISPPLDMSPNWFAPHLAYTMAKYGMSMCVLGMAEEFRTRGLAVNALWPLTTIATAAIKNLLGGDEVIRLSRKPEIMADAAHAILVRDSRECTGNFFIDEEVLRSVGVADFDHYSVVPGAKLMNDFFVT